MTSEEKDDLAEDYGYIHYRCPRHGGFWSDSGPYCEYCPHEKEEEEKEGPNEEEEA